MLAETNVFIGEWQLCGAIAVSYKWAKSQIFLPIVTPFHAKSGMITS